MKKTLLFMAMILLCLGTAFAEEGLDPNFAETRPIPLSEVRSEMGYFSAGSSMIEAPDDIVTGEPCVFTAEPDPDCEKYAYKIMRLDREAWMLYTMFYNKYKSTPDPSLTYTFYEPGTYYVRLYSVIEDADGSVSLTQLDVVTVDVTGTDYVEQKINQIVAECPVSGEYEVALWLHDYLINNAYYDPDYTRYGPEGVAIVGYGVCDSYSKAYELLLTKMGIDSQRVTSQTHAWNAVYLEGEWHNIDCTWDDPSGETVPVSGDEYHLYFGLPNDILFKVRAHQPENDNYPDCHSVACNYVIRNDEMPWQPAIEEAIPGYVDEYRNSFSIALEHRYPIGGGWYMPISYPVLNYGLSRYKLSDVGMPYRGRTLVFDVDYDAENDPWNMRLAAHYKWNGRDELRITADEIGEEAFMAAAATSVIIDSQCERIEPRCFADMPNLEEVIIRENVTDIAEDAFRGAPENLLVVTDAGSAAEAFARANGYCLDIE